jgi:hypothetical protein
MQATRSYAAIQPRTDPLLPQMIDLPWLLQQYPASARGKPLLLVLGKLNDLAGM